ncbi:hypothetical protein STCU_08392 [Strigomonas culicis]|uniref:Uncharacterized protein n=1 Tax=Strigomonas culicis TaxID=28005 RepID=S9TZH0_9TRYP|nr:hypothetical protein STCU_08392 [Strigomonas culicis]|eukprot:EPY22004.1 hypothetical protein STCU_08392 [Strigomonas culicis]
MFPSRTLRLLTVVPLLLVGVTTAYQFAPVLTSFTVSDSTDSYAAALASCGARGGYLGTEPNTAMRTHHAELGGAAKGAVWYAFLGANVEAPDITPLCKDSYMTNPTDTASPGDCIYRWKMGRYLDFTDDSTFIGTKWYYRSGISFYRGTLATTSTTDCTYTINNTLLPCGPISGFSSFFMTSSTAPSGTDSGTYIANRPGFDNGHYLVLVGTGTSTVWSDNEPSGGYTYKGATSSGSTYTLSTAGIAGTSTDFISLCDAQAPSRIMIEPYTDPDSKSNLMWWVIFLCILFFLLGLSFVILACCQEREDMDEPPEDAPEWAQHEASQVMKTKRYVSQNSFRLVDASDDYEREMGSYSDMGSRSAGGENEKYDDEGSRSMSRSGSNMYDEAASGGGSYREGYY